MIHSPSMYGMNADTGRKLNIALSVILATAAVYSIGWYIYSPVTRPSASDYREFSDYLHRQWRDGDVVAVAPFWAERLREYVGDLNVINPPDLPDEDLAVQKRLWLLSVFGYARNNDLLGRLQSVYRLAETKSFGKLELYMFELPRPAVVSFDFMRSLDKAHVYVEMKGGQKKECDRWQGDRWQCPGNHWEYVGKELLDIDDNPRPCIWAHPNSNGVVTAEFKGVPMSAKLVGHTGLTYVATRAQDGTPVTLEVLIDGRRALVHVNENKKGWNRFEIDTSAMQGTNHDVVFKVTAPRDGMRHFGFDAVARDR